MAVDLFSLVLEGVSSWAIGRFLDTISGCGRCGWTDNQSIENYETTNIICPKCNGYLDQYTNATNHTVNSNGSIAAAYVSNIHWERWGNIWTPNFTPHFDVNVVNSKYNDILIRLTLSKFQGETFYEDDMILHPRYERSIWNDCTWKIPPKMFPSEGGSFLIKILAYNTWGEELHQARSMGKYSGREEPDED